MDILNKKQKIVIIGITALMVVFIGYYIINKANDDNYINLETEENYITQNIIKEEESSEEKNIIVHVIGEVINQGIVKVKAGARISDIIDAAGGTTREADLSKINLAYSVQDGQKIYVPSIFDEVELENITEGAGEKVLEEKNKRTSKININTASQTELETLNGIGPSTALKIINYREENGEFEEIEDIKNVPGIGETKFESVKDYICVK